ncbi:MAG TPA: HAD-IIIA family hydrolase [Ornithinicoccus sp.]|nr:HAD-IIIA family hydrolase [Ornithinicoccus sp.]
MTSQDAAYTVVVPTVGRPSLDLLLADLADQPNQHLPVELLVVDDRRLGTGPGAPPEPLLLPDLPFPSRVLRSGGRGPAAARNAGWRSARTGWVAFLDDDVRLPEGWAAALAADLATAGEEVGGVQGEIRVPLPADRRPTDWERNTAGLETALWATADMAYRRAALAAVHGFDERFPLAYREDADLALRVREAGWQLVRGRRHVVHPARPAPWDVSIRTQRGAASDALMRALHGRSWRQRAGTGRGRFRWHLATVASGVAAVGAALTGYRRTSAFCTTATSALTLDFLARRLAPGPPPGQEGWRQEWARMAVTSMAIPWVAVWHRLVAEARYRRGVAPWPPPTRAVLFDRDGTLVEDVPYNGDPARVAPVPEAGTVIKRLRAADLRLGVVSNQSGIGRGLLTEDDMERVNERLQELVGPLDTWQHCPHRPDEGCACRKPGAELVLRAAAAVGVAPHECVVVGDIGSDVDAARAAGARSVLVPTPVTRPEEVDTAEYVAGDLVSAAELVLGMADGNQP